MSVAGPKLPQWLNIAEVVINYGLPALLLFMYATGRLACRRLVVYNVLLTIAAFALFAVWMSKELKKTDVRSWAMSLDNRPEPKVNQLQLIAGVAMLALWVMYWSNIISCDLFVKLTLIVYAFNFAAADKSSL